MEKNRNEDVSGSIVDVRGIVVGRRDIIVGVRGGNGRSRGV